MYQTFNKIIEDVNVIVGTYGEDDGPMGDIQLSPQNGTVGFGSGLHGWAFTLKDFAKMYVNKFKIEETALMKRLWGSQFYNAKEKKWHKEEVRGSQRGFTFYVLKPIYEVFNSCMNKTKDEAKTLIEKMGIK